MLFREFSRLMEVFLQRTPWVVRIFRVSISSSCLSNAPGPPDRRRNLRLVQVDRNGLWRRGRGSATRRSGSPGSGRSLVAGGRIGAREDGVGDEGLRPRPDHTSRAGWAARRAGGEVRAARFLSSSIPPRAYSRACRPLIARIAASCTSPVREIGWPMQTADLSLPWRARA